MSKFKFNIPITDIVKHFDNGNRSFIEGKKGLEVKQEPGTYHRKLENTDFSPITH